MVMNPQCKECKRQANEIIDAQIKNMHRLYPKHLTYRTIMGFHNAIYAEVMKKATIGHTR